MVCEVLGWEVAGNLPLARVETLIDAPVKPGEAGRPLAIGIDSRSRGFRPALLVRRIKELRESGRRDIQTLFLDCAGAELERRFSETRRRHPDRRSVVEGQSVSVRVELGGRCIIKTNISTLVYLTGQSLQ